jgi:hypothetical protein
MGAAGAVQSNPAQQDELQHVERDAPEVQAQIERLPAR